MINPSKLIAAIVGIIVVVAAVHWYATRAATPAETNLGWQTFTDTEQGVSFQYPKDLGTQYISTVDWPPKVGVLAGTFTCSDSGSEITPMGQVQKKVVSGHTYCVTKESEGAAGSTYTLYTYAFQKGNKVMTLTFSLRFPQCANYDDPKKTECENERTAFDIDSVADRIVQSFR
jgi:hypothetical protein